VKHGGEAFSLSKKITGQKKAEAVGALVDAGRALGALQIMRIGSE